LTDSSWAEALVTLVKDGRARSVEVRRVNGGGPVGDDAPDDLAVVLRDAGFVDGYRGFVHRA
jgi:ATP-dependent Lhr-like helicase